VNGLQNPEEIYNVPQKYFSLLTHPEVVHGGYCLLKFLGDLHGDVLEKAGLNWAKRR
jgi:hypothetical protein